MTPTDTLNIGRGIEHIARAAGWEPYTYDGTLGWKYPVRDEHGTVLAYRWKSAISPAPEGKKYVWLGSKGDARYYVTKGLTQHIADAHGTLYLAAGEVDLLTYVAAGVFNVLSWFGEGNIPPTLTADLHAWGVRTVRYAPDADEAGYKAARKLRDILAETGITLELYDVRGGITGVMLDSHEQYTTIEDVNDVNDVWQVVERDKGAFTTALIQSLTLDAPAPAFDLDAIAQQVEAALAPSGDRYDDKGYNRKAFRCPFADHEHDDESPAAHWNRETYHLYCFKCGTAYNLKATAAALGIPWAATASQNGHSSKAGLATAPDRSAPEPPQDASESLFVPGTDALRALANDSLLTGDPADTENALGTPVVFPVPWLQHMGGFARVLSEGKLVAIVAPTGGGKTTFNRTLIHYLQQRGESILLDSPEWTSREHAANEIQRVTKGQLAVGRIKAVRAYNDLMRQGQKDNIPSWAKPFTRAEWALYWDAIDKLNEQMKHVYYPRDHVNMSLEQSLEQMRRRIEAIRAGGERISCIAVDYIGLRHLSEKADRDRNQDEMALIKIKDFAMQNSVVAFVSLQIDQTSYRIARAKGRPLDISAARWVNPAPINLAFTLNPQFERDFDGCLIYDKDGNEKQKLVHKVNGKVINDADVESLPPLERGKVTSGPLYTIAMVKNNEAAVPQAIRAWINPQSARFEPLDA